MNVERKDITDSEYHAIEAFSNSKIQDLELSPSHLKEKERKSSTASDIGTATHMKILEPDRFDQSLGFDATVGINTAAYRKFCDENFGKTILHVNSKKRANEIWSKMSEVDQNCFLQSDTEIAVVGDIDGIPVKGKIDAYHHDKKFLFDIKTTNSLGYFVKNFYESHYHTQAYWYRFLMEALGYPVKEVFFYVIENSRPYANKVVGCEDIVFELGKEDVESALNVYAGCHRSGDWSAGYSDEILRIGAPRWR